MRPSDPGSMKSGASSPGFNSTLVSAVRVATLYTPASVAPMVVASRRNNISGFNVPF